MTKAMLVHQGELLYKGTKTSVVKIDTRHQLTKQLEYLTTLTAAEYAKSVEHGYIFYNRGKNRKSSVFSFLMRICQMLITFFFFFVADTAWESVCYNSLNGGLDI